MKTSPPTCSSLIRSSVEASSERVLVLVSWEPKHALAMGVLPVDGGKRSATSRSIQIARIAD